MRVISGTNSRYKLLDLVTHKERVYHTSDMKPFLYDSTVTDPLDVARRDHMEFFVESVIDMKGDTNSKKIIRIFSQVVKLRRQGQHLDSLR